MIGQPRHGDQNCFLRPTSNGLRLTSKHGRNIRRRNAYILVPLPNHGTGHREFLGVRSRPNSYRCVGKTPQSSPSSFSPVCQVPFTLFHANESHNIPEGLAGVYRQHWTCLRLSLNAAHKWLAPYLIAPY